MDVHQAIKARRAYRSLAPVKITKALIQDLAQHVQLAPSCFNNQPWRFVFVYQARTLKKMHEALSPGNEWAQAASMIIAVCSRRQDDCIIRDREYYQFDTGLGVAFLILRATELGLVAHPIAGFSPQKTRKILNIPPEYKVITLIIVGRHSEKTSAVLSEKQVEAERKRPKRLPLKNFIFLNKFSN